MIMRHIRPRSQRNSIGDLYGAIVAQARCAVFYDAYGVPDTVEGRFDLIVLHLVILLDRLDRIDGGGRSLGQKLFDAFCRDLDGNLREMGVGDLAVPREMRRFAEAFYGRRAAYLAALALADDRELEKALARYIFQGAAGDGGASRLARYARAAVRQFQSQDDGALLHGKIIYPSPESFAHE
jgi:cytochrome b pre-mRNA-processing protein 3